MCKVCTFDPKKNQGAIVAHWFHREMLKNENVEISTDFPSGQNDHSGEVTAMGSFYDLSF